jgi:hypothetical protein
MREERFAMAGSLITAAVVIVAAAVSIVLYVLPTVIGWHRGVPDLGVVAVVNLLLGWTLAGWLVALVMALRTASTGAPAVQIVQNMPPAAPPPPPGYWPQPAPPAGFSRRPAAAPPLHLPPGPGGRPSGAGDPEQG